jgi:hypothetical protein
MTTKKQKRKITHETKLGVFSEFGLSGDTRRLLRNNHMMHLTVGEFLKLMPEEICDMYDSRVGPLIREDVLRCIEKWNGEPYYQTTKLSTLEPWERSLFNQTNKALKTQDSASHKRTLKEFEDVYGCVK